MVRIEGATEEQVALLQEILASLPSTVIRALRVEPYDALPFAREPGSPPCGPAPEERSAMLGVALRLVEPESVSPRGNWEIDLVAGAFRTRSARAGLEPVRAVMHSAGGHGLDPPVGDPEAVRPPGPTPALDVESVRTAGAAAGTVERFDVFDLDGLVVSGRVRVDEPHRFMRERATPLIRTIAAALTGAVGWYLEIVDEAPSPVLVRAASERFGVKFDRPDLDCCNGFSRHAIPLTEQRKPLRCPVYGDPIRRY